MDIQPTDETKDLARLYDETLQRVERGAITKGRVIAVRSDGVVVDVGYKSEGIIPVSEFTQEEMAVLKAGDYIEVFVERINDRDGVVALSRDRASKIRTWETLTAAYTNNSLIEGKVTGKTKGGLMVNVFGVTAFLPASQIDVKGIRDIDSYVGQTIPLKVIKMTQQKASFNQAASTSIVVSRRIVVEEKRSQKKIATLKELKEGDIIKGIVKNITDYGVFIDLGGVDGLLHISDISWRRVSHPSEFFSLGDEKEFIVLKYDPESEKVTLGYKQKTPDLWQSVEGKYTVGMKLKGKVVNIVDYGVFVEVEEGLEGLIHVSELDWSPRQKRPSKYVSAGDEVEAIVLNVNRDERRLSLSIKQLQPKPWALVSERYETGQKITGKVKTITDFGAFVRLPEGVDGLIHVSDLSWIKHIKHPSEVLKKGQKIEAVILNLEPDKERMSLGLKQLGPDPWQNEIPVKFKIGEEFTGRVLKISDFGIFVELEGGVEGLVYSSEIDESREHKEGAEIQVRIIKVNAEERKIGLSMKRLKTHEN